MIWAVASILWGCFSFYMFHIDNLPYHYRQYQKFAYKVAQGRAKNPYRYDYYMRGYKLTLKRVQDANNRLAFFLMLGIAFPGLMLAVGTFALRNIDKPDKGKKA